MLSDNHAVPPHVVHFRQDKQQDIEDAQSHKPFVGCVVYFKVVSVILSQGNMMNLQYGLSPSR